MINKKALNLFFVFCIIIVVCIFLSLTLSNVSTPRVVVGYVSNGMLTKATLVEGYIFNQNIEEIGFGLAKEYPYIIKTINVEAGDVINAGDVIYEIYSTPQTLVEAIKTAEDDYDYYLEKLLLEQAKAGVNNVNFDSSSFEAYEEMIEKEKEMLLLELSLITDADELGLVDNSMTYLEKLDYLKTEKSVQLSEQLATIIGLQEKIDDTLDLMKEKFDRTNGKGIYEYSQIIDAERRLLAAEYTLHTLQQNENDIDDIISPVSGVVVEVYIQEGEEYAGTKAIIVIENSMPFASYIFDESMDKEALNNNSYTVVYNDKEYDADFVKVNIRDNIVILSFRDELILKDSSLFNLYGAKVSIHIKTIAGEGTLIPIEALQGYSEKQVIYLLKEVKGFWGAKWKIEAIEVEIVDVNSKVALVEGTINRNQQIIVGWDRLIYDGQTVLPFSN